jgi:nitrate/nitrite transporter NarK
MANVPRTFKVPFGPVIPIVGIVGNIFMIYNIASDTETKMIIYRTVLVIFAVLAVYAFIWVKKVMKRPLFKAYEVKDIMAMENELYHLVREEQKKSA